MSISFLSVSYLLFLKLYSLLQWHDVFDDSTGKWNFCPKSPSQDLVDCDPFSAALKDNVLNRHITDFSPTVLDTCECGVK